LHHRSDIGIRSAGRYHSIDTGKYGMAPYFADLLADRICREHDHRNHMLLPSIEAR